MEILVTNDEGVQAPSLLALVQALRKLDANITVLAPERNWSASGHVKTMHRPLRLSPTVLADGSSAWQSDGAPSDCVALAMMGALEQDFDLLVSGINPNANIGLDVTYSGTVTAAMEAAIAGLPAVAVSIDGVGYDLSVDDYAVAAKIAREVAQTAVANGLPANTLLNLNVPYLPADQIRGIAITRQGLRIYHDELVRRADPRGRPYYWIGGKAPTGIKEEGTDIGSLAEGWVSITPIQLDLTAHHLIETLQTWNWG